MSDELDNAAQAALWALLNAPKEHLGALYHQNGAVAATPTVTSGSSQHIKGSLAIPAGSLAALFHNHPRLATDRRNGGSTAEDFSPEDLAQAKRLGVPSYIQTPSNALRRYDPTTGNVQSVLAEIPVALIEALRK